MFMYTCVDVFMYAHVCAWVGVYIGVSVSACACIRTCTHVYIYYIIHMQHKFCLCAVKELIMTDQLVYVNVGNVRYDM